MAALCISSRSPNRLVAYEHPHSPNSASCSLFGPGQRHACTVETPGKKPQRHSGAADLVFIQNGMLQPWLDANGLSACTQALVYFAVAKLGEAPVDGKTKTNPEGLTAAHGPHAQAFSDLLKTGGLSCQVLLLRFRCDVLQHTMWLVPDGTVLHIYILKLESTHIFVFGGCFCILALRPLFTRTIVEVFM